MNRIVVERRVGDGGLLVLTLPLGAGEAGQDVRVTIEPIGRQPAMTPDEWRNGILATAGGWQGEFECSQLHQLEERDALS
ncbi:MULTISPECIES: hypothetical protein [unclassified Schlesneria]|uniref:hypothetical protein n=1 Tax=unclassified Schlesneria TaxID=2762017 RepID=UPI002F2598D0